MGTFDPNTFLNQTYDAGSTEALVVPEGEYDFMMSDAAAADWFKSGEYADKTTGEKKTWARFQPLLNCLDEGVRAKMKRDKVLVPFDGGFVDFNADGSLDMSEGKNVKINQLRAAVDQNKKGVPWSPQMMSGAGPFRGIVRHEVGDDKVTRHRVVRVTKK